MEMVTNNAKLTSEFLFAAEKGGEDEPELEVPPTPDVVFVTTIGMEVVVVVVMLLLLFSLIPLVVVILLLILLLLLLLLLTTGDTASTVLDVGVFCCNVVAALLSITG